jgi:hypothetical protein
VLAHAAEEHGVEFEEGWKLKQKVQALCDELGVATGWPPVGAVAVAASPK